VAPNALRCDSCHLLFLCLGQLLPCLIIGRENADVGGIVDGRVCHARGGLIQQRFDSVRSPVPEHLGDNAGAEGPVHGRELQNKVG
jgi:hypothetical protein